MICTIKVRFPNQNLTKNQYNIQIIFAVPLIHEGQINLNSSFLTYFTANIYAHLNKVFTALLRLPLNR